MAGGADLAVAHWLRHTSGRRRLRPSPRSPRVAKTGTDGKWRAPDSLGYNEHIRAVAVVSHRPSPRFGLEWTARDDGHGESRASAAR